MLPATALAVLLGAVGPPAAADALRDALLACSNEPDDAGRLRCFDASVADLRKGDAPTTATAAGATAAGATAAGATAAGATAAGTTAAADAPPTSLSPEERFGLRGDLKRERTGDLAELSATATAVSAKPRGELVVTLDNGQVWAEIAPGSSIRLKAGDPVRIQAGTLGSFILIAPNGRSSKVARIR